DGEPFDHVDVLASPVVPSPGIPLGVLVREHRALRLHHRDRGVVLRGDHLEAVALAPQLGVDLLRDLRVEFGEFGVERRVLDGGQACHATCSSLAAAYSSMIPRFAMRASRSKTSVAPASAVMLAWSYDGAISTTSAPTMLMPSR